MSILSINHEHLSINKMVCLYSWGFFTWKLHHQGHGVRKKRSCSKVVKQQFPKTILKCVFSEIWVRANHWLFPLIVTHFGWFWGTPIFGNHQAFTQVSFTGSLLMRVGSWTTVSTFCFSWRRQRRTDILGIWWYLFGPM